MNIERLTICLYVAATAIVMWVIVANAGKLIPQTVTITRTEYKDRVVKVIDPCKPQERIVKEEVIVPVPILIHVQSEPVTLTKTVYVDRPVTVEVERIVYVQYLECRPRRR